jgi:hypothetical protein
MGKLEHELHMVKAGKGPYDALMLLTAELKELRERVAQLERQNAPNQHRPARGDTLIGPAPDYSAWRDRMNRRGEKL